MKKYQRSIGIIVSLAMIVLMVGFGGYYLYRYISLDQIVIDGDETDNPVFYPDDKEDADPVSKNEEETETKPGIAVEKFQYPFVVDAVVVKPFFDTGKDLSSQVSAVTLFENVYRPNMGVDYAYENKAFNVVAILSGTVTDTFDDPIFGATVVIRSDHGYEISYSSLGQVAVKANQKVKQGDLIGVASENIYNPELKKHLHVEVQKNGKYLDLETLIHQPVTKDVR